MKGFGGNARLGLAAQFRIGNIRGAPLPVPQAGMRRRLHLQDHACRER
jgi:hypothetical protein